MPVQIRDAGQYELFETSHQHRILVLNGRRWFAWVRGQQGEILVHSDSDHQKDHTIAAGRFYLVDFENDPKYKDMPHLFLQRDGQYEELMVPNGLPSESDMQKLVVKTDEALPTDKLEEYLKHPAAAGPGEARMETPDGGSMANVTHHLKGIDFPADKQRVVGYARDRGAPAPVLETLEGLPDGEVFQNMADLTHAVGEED